MITMMSDDVYAMLKSKMETAFDLAKNDMNNRANVYRFNCLHTIDFRVRELILNELIKLRDEGIIE